MNEIKRNEWVGRIDEDWLSLALELSFDEEADETMDREAILERLLTLRQESPYFLLDLLHQGILSLILNQCGDYLETEVSEIELARLRRNILEDLANVKETDIVFDVPNNALVSSAAFAAILVQEKVLPELVLKWDDQVHEAISFITVSLELWNLINYYGAISPADLTRMHAAIYQEEDPLGEELLPALITYIQMNLSEDIYYDERDGEAWLLTEYAGADPLEIMEDIKKRPDLDYKVLSQETLMNMIHGITPFELLKVLDYLSSSFKIDETGEEQLSDINFLHDVIMALRGRDGENLPRFIHEDLGWAWDTQDLEARELIFQDLLKHMGRFKLKGNTQAELDGEEEEIDPYLPEEEEPFFDDEIPEEFSFKLRKPKKDEDSYLN